MMQEIAGQGALDAWTPVESSNLAAYRYDRETQHLDIRFKKGIIYRYFKVPVEVVENLQNAESVGRFFAARIKQVFDAERLREEM